MFNLLRSIGALMRYLLTPRRKAGLGAVLLVVAAGAQAETINFSNIPLYLISSATPNVMLFVDNSGSMNTIIRATAFDVNTNYTDWSPGNSWYNTSSNISRSTLVSNSGRGCDNNGHNCRCPNNYTWGSTGTANKCLLLPDPVGGNATRYDGAYLNYLFQTYASNTDLTTVSAVPNTFRMREAINAATNLVNNNSDLRFGLMTFDPNATDVGGLLRANCGTAAATLTNTISTLSAQTSTPLAEAFYDITRYFRGLTNIHTGAQYTSPIQYRCQLNFAIVVTDGFPTYDSTFPNNDPDDPSHKLPDWDGLHPATTAATYPVFPEYSDGYGPNQGNEGNEGYTLYLDDMAKFAYDLDFKADTLTDNAGQLYTGKQNLQTYTIGFTTANQMLEDAAAYGHGAYYTVQNGDQLQAALQNAIGDIRQQTASSASVAVNTGAVSSSSLAFQARFTNADWSGTLSATPISDGLNSQPGCTGVPAGQLCTRAWEASAVLAGQNYDTGRTIISYNPASRAGIPFRYTSLGSGQQSVFNRSPLAPATTDSNGALRVNYLRGDRTQEANSATPKFRTRNSVLGDIIDSNPFYVGAPAANYGFDDYSTFKNNNASRTGMVYVGANDGMLHGFRASDGRELLAYVPSPVIGTTSAPKISRLTDPAYTHTYMVDASVSVGDAYYGSAWHSVLVGGLGIGGQGIYALDVTNPSNFTEANANSTVLWEFTDSDDADLGNTFSQPAIVRMANGRWAAVFGNGYDNQTSDGHASTTGQASLYILFLDHNKSNAWNFSGSNPDAIKLTVTAPSISGVVNFTGPNGLSTPAAVDTDGDGYIDHIYAGDLAGNLWKFDVSSATASNWHVSYSGSPLFTATEDVANNKRRLPITERPEIGYNLLTSNLDNDVVVYFGTGRYLDVNDSSNTGQPTQTFFGIYDEWTDTKSVTITRSNLQQQQVVAEQTISNTNYRFTTSNTVDTTTKYGWYINLISPNTTDNRGERQVTDPVLRSGRIIFTTLIPSNSPCEAGGTGWLMELDANSGAAIAQPVFDVNGDGVIDSNDLRTVTINGHVYYIGGEQPGGGTGLLTTPTIVQNGDNQEVKLISRSDGSVSTVRESTHNIVGRITWRELTQ